MNRVAWCRLTAVKLAAVINLDIFRKHEKGPIPPSPMGESEMGAAKESRAVLIRAMTLVGYSLEDAEKHIVNIARVVPLLTLLFLSLVIVAKADQHGSGDFRQWLTEVRQTASRNGLDPRVANDPREKRWFFHRWDMGDSPSEAIRNTIHLRSLPLRRRQ
jgi:hypothetical protein